MNFWMFLDRNMASVKAILGGLFAVLVMVVIFAPLAIGIYCEHLEKMEQLKHTAPVVSTSSSASK